MIAPENDPRIETRGPRAGAVLPLLRQLREQGIELRSIGGRLRVSAPPGAVSAALLDRIAASRDELLQLLAEAGGTEAAPRADGEGGPDSPLTERQRRLWLLQHVQPASTAYNVVYAFRIAGPLDREALRRSLVRLVERHEILRATFSELDGEPVQHVGEADRLDLEVRELADPDELHDALTAEARRPFDLHRETPLRALLVGLPGGEHALMLTVHHIACDGWSMEILLDELLTVYAAEARGEQPDLQPAPSSLELARREAGRVTREALAPALAFHRERLAGLAEPLALPEDRPRPARFGHRGGSVRFEIAADLLASLDALGRAHSATLYMVTLAAFETLLGRITGQTDFAVGTPVANRWHPDTERAVGFFAETIVLRADLRDDPAFTELIARVRDASLAAHEHRPPPLQWLVEALDPPRDRSRTPLFQALFTYHDARARRLDRAGTRWTRLDVDAGGCKTDLTLLLERHERGLVGWIEYNAEILLEASIGRLAKNFVTLLRDIVADPGRRVSRLDVVHPDERRAQAALNATSGPLPDVGGFHELFERQAVRTPERVAATSGGRSWTYAELDRHAGRLARRLAREGIGPGSRVGIALDRGLPLLEATLGVLKAGAAYVPLDPEYPRERLAFIVADADLALVLTESALCERIPEGPPQLLLPLEHRDGRDARDDAGGESAVQRAAVGAGDVAYLIYTSGSTGRPKGVMVPHGAVVNFLTAMAHEPGCAPDDRLVAVTTLSFDIAVLELFLPLTVGATVVVADRESAGDGGRLAQLVESEGGTLLQATPVTWELLLDAGWRGGEGFKALCGGEALPVPLARRLQEACGSVWNLFGPTETTVWSTCCRLEGPDAPVLIGTPILNTQVHVLDRNGQVVPFGVVGELCIGGRGVTLGYRGLPELTRERFVPDPFAREAGARLYRTGDLVRLLPEGLAFVGRADHQVKLRGHRLELGEIEAALCEEPGVSRCVVVVDGTDLRERWLVACVVPAAGASLDPAALRERLRLRLPEVMVPSFVRVLDALPLTPNGKLDRRALAALRPGAEPPAGGADALRGPLEQLIADAWRRVLRIDNVGPSVSFFDLGGHSLLVLRLADALGKACGTRFSPRLVFEATTVREQAAWINSGREYDGTSVVPLHAEGAREPLFCICGIQLYQELARRLDADRPVYGIFLPIEAALLTRVDPELSVTGMARKYVAAIRGKQPRGPYHLAGVSFGGVLAYETARQLRAAGEQVELLAILDVVLPGAVRRDGLRWVSAHLRRAFERLPRLLGGRLRPHGDEPDVNGAARNGSSGSAKCAEPAEAWRDEPQLPIDAEDAAIRQLRSRHYERAWAEYQDGMQPYDGQVVLVRALGQAEALVGCRIAEGCGWLKYVPASRLHEHRIPGGHLGILGPPHVDELARVLREHLRAPTAAPTGARSGRG